MDHVYESYRPSISSSKVIPEFVFFSEANLRLKENVTPIIPQIKQTDTLFFLQVVQST